MIGNAVVGYVLESHFLLGFSYADLECCIYVETKTKCVIKSVIISEAEKLPSLPLPKKGLRREKKKGAKGKVGIAL